MDILVGIHGLVLRMASPKNPKISGGRWDSSTSPTLREIGRGEEIPRDMYVIIKANPPWNYNISLPKGMFESMIFPKQDMSHSSLEMWAFFPSVSPPEFNCQIVASQNVGGSKHLITSLLIPICFSNATRRALSSSTTMWTSKSKIQGIVHDFLLLLMKRCRQSSSFASQLPG